MAPLGVLPRARAAPTRDPERRPSIGQACRNLLSSRELAPKTRIPLFSTARYLDYHDVLEVGNLTQMRAVLAADGVSHLVRGRAAEGTCSLYVDLPRNGVGVELRSREFGGVLRDECEARPFDLCAAA